MNDFIRFIAPLLITCIVSAAALSVAFDVTESFIREKQVSGLQATLREVFPAADSFSAAAQKIPDAEVYEAGINGSLVGVAVVVSAKGYANAIRILVGIELGSRAISGVRILQESETPGLGSRVREPSFLGQFSGKSAEQKFDAITGATVSSSAVINAAKNASLAVLEAYK
jgi:electron transport complex protein RnfG